MTSQLTIGILRNWEDMYNIFMTKYYSSYKTIDLRNKGESIHEDWEHYKLLLTQCPLHQYSLALQVQLCYDGLSLTAQNMADISVRGYIGDKMPEELVSLYELRYSNSQQKAI